MKNFQHIELFQASKSPKAPQQPKKERKRGENLHLFQAIIMGHHKSFSSPLSNSFSPTLKVFHQMQREKI